MNHTEAAQVLAVMAAVHPWDVGDDMAEVWYRTALQDVSLDVGLAVAMRLVEREERFPTPAAFNSEVRSERERERRQENMRALPTGERRGLPVELLAELRAVLAGKGGRKHWHGGPNPCEVCGGMKPADW